MSDPTFPAYPGLTGTGLLLVLVPLPWHLRAWNAGTCLFMLWTAVASLFSMVNSILWHGNTINKASVWCDISVHVTLTMSTAIPATVFCITRQLYIITRLSSVEITPAQERRNMKIDIMIGLGLPLLQIPLQYVVQVRRYDIYEDVGCQPAIVNTVLSYPLVLLWPVVLNIISACYCVFTLHTFFKRRSELSDSLSSEFSNGLNSYLRLILLASTQFFLGLPLTGYILYLWLTQPDALVPYKSWAYVHANFFDVKEVPASIWGYDRNIKISVELYSWAIPFCSFMFFAFFGLSQEARNHYKLGYRIFHRLADDI